MVSETTSGAGTRQNQVPILMLPQLCVPAGHSGSVSVSAMGEVRAALS